MGSIQAFLIVNLSLLSRLVGHLGAHFTIHIVTFWLTLHLGTRALAIEIIVYSHHHRLVIHIWIPRLSLYLLSSLVLSYWASVSLLEIRLERRILFYKSVVDLETKLT